MADFKWPQAADANANADLLLVESAETESCDANNNASKNLPAPVRRTAPASTDERPGPVTRSTEGDDTVLSSSAKSRHLRQTDRARLDTELRGGTRSSESNTSESDDWQLLDAEEQSVSSTSSSCEKSAGPTSDTHGLPFVRTGDRMERTSVANHPRPAAGSKHQRTSVRYHDIVPPNRERLSPALIQICATIYSLLPLASLLAFVTFLCLLFTRFWYITALYYSYLVFDAKTCNRGGRRWPSVYRAKFWSYLSAYFPVKLRYSGNFKLSPDENYILNYHPHGISAFGCVTAFATNGLNFSDLFPGIRSIFMVHETSFLVPIMRETFSLRGDCSVNSSSFDFLLGKRWLAADAAGSGPQPISRELANARGNLLALCGGGLAEADLSNMDTLKIVCATRKGFVKKSLIHGAHLIPCIAFGENSVFNKINFKPGTFLHKLETTWYNLFRFKHPIYYGRSLLFGDKSRGPVPYKRPITVVMGDPIIVARVANPSQEQIDELHSRYIERLMSMYEDNKAQLCGRFDTKLELV